MSACLVGQPAALDDGEWCAAETLADARFHSISGETVATAHLVVCHPES